MIQILTLSLLFVLLAFAGSVQAHITAWSKGMFCKNGLSHTDQPNADYPMLPLFQESQENWFMHGPCIDYPPPAGEFLELPAGGTFEVELSANRAYTHLSYNGTKFTNWGDGQHHPANYSTKNLGGFPKSGSGCIHSPNLHTHGEWDAAGTAFAIAYKSDIKSVTMDDLTVFTVAANTPYRVQTTYEVPADMPECPAGGCICAWGWVPNGCGEANVYMMGYRCKVTGAKPNAPAVAKPQAAVWCENMPWKCVQGAKKMIIWHQASGNTVTVPEIEQVGGGWATPRYSGVMGFNPGAQKDIFTNSVLAKDPAPPPPPPPPPPAAAPSGWKHAGCFTDSTKDRALSGSGKLSNAHMTVDFCIAHCSSKGLRIAGVEFGTECWCGSKLKDSKQVSQSSCSMACGGDKKHSCGAGNHLDVYERLPGHRRDEHAARNARRLNRLH